MINSMIIGFLDGAANGLAIAPPFIVDPNIVASKIETNARKKNLMTSKFCIVDCSQKNQELDKKSGSFFSSIAKMISAVRIHFLYSKKTENQGIKHDSSCI